MVILLLFAGLCGMLGTVCWIMRRGNSNVMTRLFVACQLSIVMWLVSQLLILFSESVRQLWISYLIGNIGICCFSPFWLMFSAEYAEIRSKFMKVLCVLPIIMFALIATNPLHHLYYADFSGRNSTYGLLFYIFQLLFYILIISGIVLLSRKNERSRIMLVLATVIPLLINVLTVSGVIRSEIELTPLFFAFSVIMILIAIRRYGLLNINRIAINSTIDSISTAVIVFSSDGCMTYMNRYAENILPPVRTLSEFIAYTGTDNGDVLLDGCHYNVRCSQMSDDFTVIIMNNVSEYYELAEAEKKLTVEHERNRIAQEIHDTAGHIFTMISSLAKVLQVETDRDKIQDYIAEIDGLSRSGITQLRCSINNLRDDEFMTSVTRAVQTVINAVRNIDVDVCIQGEENGRFDFCICEVYDNVREMLTNAMRYSEANRIDIIVKFLADRLELYFLDNGVGCAEIQENNGLTGIRTRTEKIGGEVKFTSSAGNGFSAFIKIFIQDCSLSQTQQVECGLSD